MPLCLKAIILGIIQGLTEFLPISSTGHMIIVDEYLKLPDGFRETFLVVVQLGSILSVLVYFRKKLFPSEMFGSRAGFANAWSLWWRVALGVVPAIVLGGLFGSWIKEKLYSTVTVATTLALGGVILLFIERLAQKTKITEIRSMPTLRILGIGLAQAFAMIPGVSRSAATIIGALLLGMSRELAVEYSFYLAIPTMFAASAYSLLKEGAALSAQQWLAVGVGFVVAFLVAWAVIAFFISYIRRRDFRMFGWYRIALAAVILVWLYFCHR